MKRWIIVKRRDSHGDPHRRWQLWRANGIHRRLSVERATHGACVAAMDRLDRLDRLDTREDAP